MNSFLFLGLCLLALGLVSGFSIVSPSRQTTTALQAARRDFVAAAMGAAFVSLASPVLAIDDLAMPTAEEEKSVRCFYSFKNPTHKNTPDTRLFCSFHSLPSYGLTVTCIIILRGILTAISAEFLFIS